MIQFRTLDDLDVNGQTVLVRGDLNVPITKSQITNTQRIEYLIPTLKDLANREAKVVILSHLGRPKNGIDLPLSLRHVHPQLERILDHPVRFAQNCIGSEAKKIIDQSQPGDFILLENLRFHPGEVQNDPVFVEALAELGDLYVNDAFSCSHRSHASIEGLARRLPSVAGRLLNKEVTTLDRILKTQSHSTVILIGGIKSSTKIKPLSYLIRKADTVILSGGMANTFLVAKGKSVGRSCYEPELLEHTQDISARACSIGCNIMLPLDVVVVKSLDCPETLQVVSVDAVPPDSMIVDIGPETVEVIAKVLQEHSLVIWNGALGVFERSPFDAGTIAVAQQIARLTGNNSLISIAGGGDTVAALVKANVAKDFTYVSLAGGALLEWLENENLPGISALRRVQGISP